MLSYKAELDISKHFPNQSYIGDKIYPKYIYNQAQLTHKKKFFERKPHTHTQHIKKEEEESNTRSKHTLDVL